MPNDHNSVLQDGIQDEILQEAEDLKNVTDEAEEEDHLTKPFTISSYGADYTVDSLVKRMETKSFFVPPFQRSLVWNVKQASRFIESLLMGLPVPGIFVFREAQTNRHLIVDGQQRLRTLQAFYNGIFRGEEFRLLDVRKQWLERTCKDLDSSDKLRLDDSVIHTTIFRQEQPEDNIDSIYEVFERINTGGIKLSDQEIRVCVNFGPFTDLLNTLNDDANWRNLYGAVKRPGANPQVPGYALRLRKLFPPNACFPEPLYGKQQEADRTEGWSIFGVFPRYDCICIPNYWP
jgi:hypothetical protein